MGGAKAPVSKWWRTLALVAVTALIAVPLGAWGSHAFSDVPSDHTFHNDISAIADAGVTRGCNPPANTEYCPEDNVTRGQMAAFLNRLGALSGGTPVVNAATVEGWTVSELGRVAYSSTIRARRGRSWSGRDRSRQSASRHLDPGSW